MACNPSQIISALYEEKKNITDIVHEDIRVSKRTVIRKIKDGGIVARDSNQESIIIGAGKQAPMKYRNLDHEPRLLVPGVMEGANASNRNGLFTTSVNAVDDNACHGFCTLKFNQGFRRRGFEDFGIDIDTTIHCARELDRQGRKYIEGFFRGFRDNFTQFGLDNFDFNLQNQVVEKGEANASVVGANSFSVTKGGWQAPPTGRITIAFLREYRDHIMAEMEILHMGVEEDWRLEIEMPMDDWFDAVREEQIQRNGLSVGGFPMAEFEGKILKDPKDEMRGRKFHDYGDIRCFFNSRPIRGFLKKIGVVAGQDQFEFVRIHHWLNNVGEEAGVVLRPNPAYREDSVVVDGVKYNVCTAIPHIHEKSFTRYRLQKPLNVEDKGNMGVNYEVNVIDGAFIPNNVQRDKFGLAARHEFRLKTMYPELSGYILYRHGKQVIYELAVTPRNLVPGPQGFAIPEQFRECDLIDPVTVANCAACGEVPTSGGDCIAAGSAALGVVGLRPAGAVATDFLGVSKVVTLTVRRTGELAKVGSVNYDVTAGTATAGTHFTAVGATTINFAAGQEFASIPVTILEGSGDPNTDLTVVVTISTPVGVTLLTGSTVTTISINDLS